MKRKLGSFLWLITFCAVYLCSCSSTKKLSGIGNSEIIILIIDENNKPVKDYQLTITQNNLDSSGFSNEQGMCFFPGIPDGQVLVTGYKKECSRIQSVIQTQGCGDVFCFKVQGAQSVFCRALELYKNNHYEQALALIENLYAQEDTLCCNAIHLFKAYGFLMGGNRDSAQEELTLIDRNTFPELVPLFTAVSSKLEEGRNEN